MCTYYTAVGIFRRKRDSSGRTYPVILINRKEYEVDMQEMALWTCLNLRITDAQQAQGSMLCLFQRASLCAS